MKKYRLKKWYPSLPTNFKVGTEMIKYPPHNDYVSCDEYNPLRLSSKEIQNNPEFWEEVEEKDYEILSFINEEHKYIKRLNKKTNLFEWAFTADSTLEEMLKTDMNIHSVKRLSDGEVFTVGDRIKGLGRSGTISSINLDEYHKKPLLQLKCDYGIILPKAVKCKQPLFTTEDGVDIYEGDADFCWINEKSWSIQRPYSHRFYPRDTTNYKHFKLKEKAEEWIDENKPKYSKAHIKEATRETNICVTDRYTTIDTSSFWNVLKRLSG